MYVCICRAQYYNIFEISTTAEKASSTLHTRSVGKHLNDTLLDTPLCLLRSLYNNLLARSRVWIHQVLGVTLSLSLSHSILVCVEITDVSH